MAKKIWRGLVVGFFGLFLVGLALSFNVEWRTQLLVVSGCGTVICAVGWYYETQKAAIPTRGDLRLTVRKFDLSERDEYLWATLIFYNDDTVPRSLFGVKFSYRPNGTTRNYTLFDTASVFSFDDKNGSRESHEIEIPANGQETIRYKSLAPAAPLDWFTRVGAEAGLYISFGNAKRMEDVAEIMALEVTQGKLTRPDYTYPEIVNLSLDSIGQSHRLEAIIKEFRPSRWEKARQIIGRGLDW